MCVYWAIQVGLLTPLTFARHRLSPLAAFTSGAYPKIHFFYELTIFWSAKKWRKDIFSTLHPLSTVIFATATVLVFVLLHNSRFNFHCYTQLEAVPTQKSAQKCAATSRDILRKRLQSAFTLANQLRWFAQYMCSLWCVHVHCVFVWIAVYVCVCMCACTCAWVWMWVNLWL